MSKRVSFGRLLLILVVVALLVRLYKVTTPLADWHSFRQADTASVTREYVKHGVDLLHPRYHDLSNIQSGEENGGKDNVEGWRMVEFPIINGILATIIRAVPSLDLVILSRFASITASLVTLVCVVLLIKDIYGKQVGIWTGILFAFLPYSIYYSRVILPEPFMVMCVVAALLSYWKYLQTPRFHWLGITVVLFSVSLLLKPMAIFFIPAFIGLRVLHPWKLTKADVAAVIGGALTLLPLVWWRQWIMQFPMGIPSSNWLFNGGGEGKRLSPVYNIRFRPAWFRWLFFERLTKLILGFVGTVPFALGLVATLKAQRKHASLFIWVWGVGMLSYLIVFAAGNVQHDYYQVLLVPFICLAVAKGIVWMLNRSSYRLITRMAVVVGVITGLCLSWKQVAPYYHINHPDIIVAGKAADRQLPPDAKVIAPYNGDTAFLFQTNRTGWPIGFEIDEKRQEGAQYYISVNYDDETNALMDRFLVIEKTEAYVIIDLRQEKDVQ